MKSIISFLEDLPSKVLCSIMCIIVGLFVAVMSSPANAVELTAEQSQIDLFQLAVMLWEGRHDLPWYQLLMLSTPITVTLASLFTSVTPTPKPGTLWSVIYKWIEANAFIFLKAKDKPAAINSITSK